MHFQCGLCLRRAVPHPVGVALLRRPKAHHWPSPPVPQPRIDPSMLGQRAQDPYGFDGKHLESMHVSVSIAHTESNRNHIAFLAKSILLVMPGSVVDLYNGLGPALSGDQGDHISLRHGTRTPDRRRMAAGPTQRCIYGSA